MTRYRTPGERAAQQRGRDAVTRAKARAGLTQTDDDPWPTWPPSQAAWRKRCQQIRHETQENRRDR